MYFKFCQSKDFRLFDTDIYMTKAVSVTYAC